MLCILIDKASEQCFHIRERRCQEDISHGQEILSHVALPSSSTVIAVWATVCQRERHPNTENIARSNLHSPCANADLAAHPKGPQIPKYKVSAQYHDYDSEHRNPTHPMFGYLGPLGSCLTMVEMRKQEPHLVWPPALQHTSTCSCSPVNHSHLLIIRGPKGQINMRILHSGSKVQYKGDTRNQGL